MDSDKFKKYATNVLHEIDIFCRKRDIKYFICYGTLIGAIRHGGFIPWDDDIDIVMPREDYEKFLRTFNTERYKIASYETDKKYPYMFAKVYDSYTSLDEDYMKPYKIGVFVDVFPMDNWVGTKEYKKLCKLVLLFKARQMKFSKFFSFKTNCTNFIYKCISYTIPKNTLYKMINKRISNAKESNTLAVQVEAIDKCILFDKEIFKGYETTIIPFENIEVLAPANYDDILKSVYGDYMKLPPESEQVSNHAFTVKYND